MDELTKNLSIDDARRLIYKFIDNSDINTIEKFWFVELDNVHLSVVDSNIYNRILKYKEEKTEVSQALYLNCIKLKIVHNLIKKNWRRLFNNTIIEKYYNYTKDISKEGIIESLKEPSKGDQNGR